MPPSNQQREAQYAETARFLHATKSNSQADPIQLAFSITDDQGNEQIVLGEVPSHFDLYSLCVESGWIKEPRSVSTQVSSRRAARMAVAS